MRVKGLLVVLTCLLAVGVAVLVVRAATTTSGTTVDEIVLPADTGPPPDSTGPSDDRPGAGSEDATPSRPPDGGTDQDGQQVGGSDPGDDGVVDPEGIPVGSPEDDGDDGDDDDGDEGDADDDSDEEDD